jgi:hypothetical protein
VIIAVCRYAAELKGCPASSKIARVDGALQAALHKRAKGYQARLRGERQQMGSNPRRRP